MPRASLTYEEVQMIKEVLSLMVVIMKRFPDKTSLMDIIYKLENAAEEETDGEEIL